MNGGEDAEDTIELTREQLIAYDEALADTTVVAVSPDVRWAVLRSLGIREEEMFRSSLPTDAGFLSGIPISANELDPEILKVLRAAGVRF